jgi:hypothetical protein
MSAPSFSLTVSVHGFSLTILVSPFSLNLSVEEASGVLRGTAHECQQRRAGPSPRPVRACHSGRPPALSHPQRETAPTRRSVMLLRAKFLQEEGISVRTPDGALPPDSVPG